MTNLPVSGEFRVTATFGQQGSYWKNGHKGIDIVCDNRNIYSTCNGTVTRIGFDKDGFGRYVEIGDAVGNRHLFCHLKEGSVKVKQSQKVDRTTVIGVMGSTGNSSGVHLHYQINGKDAVAINPCAHLGIPNTKGSFNSANFQISKGWSLDGTGWKYYDENLDLCSEKWERDSVGWCYLGKDGYCLKNTWLKDKGKWYYLSKDCHALCGVHTINGKHYCFASEDYEGIKECQLIITDQDGQIL